MRVYKTLKRPENCNIFVQSLLAIGNAMSSTFFLTVLFSYNTMVNSEGELMLGVPGEHQSVCRMGGVSSAKQVLGKQCGEDRSRAQDEAQVHTASCFVCVFIV